MSDPTLSDIDFKNKMAWVWTTLKFQENIWMSFPGFANKGWKKDGL